MLLVVLPLGLAGCATLDGPTTPDFDEADMPNVTYDPVRPGAGGLFTRQAAWALAADGRAYRPGDTLTVTLEEATQASKRADTNVKKNAEVGIDAPKLFGSSIPLDASLGASRKYNGGGSSSQQNALHGEITVVIHDVLPSGLLKIKGEKVLVLNQGEETLQVAGYVRPADIDTNNRVSSRRIANARVRYVGRGPLGDASRAGWLTRLLTSPFAPF
ncbi:flagellar basal body L-ring protein FlgH [Chitinasiproducens palmae]|uniref:Flagellar L-ring protein n=1 Tax=Chitinasiproducens palmae TaxID=1770053 RepID=A0A1H2PKN7_9BURK|nr:flagellar basal body L-ring protein FlgH [Chitinasiproducens palmae]SDV46954.1 flagellar L-ring protein precursor FlgH [Chitinasiproducens palmae]